VEGLERREMRQRRLQLKKRNQRTGEEEVYEAQERRRWEARWRREEEQLEHR
jgi:hypothetical protein